MSADFWSAVEGQAVRAQPSGPVVDMTQPSTVESTSLPKKQVAATPKAKPVETTPLVEDVAAAAQTLRRDVPQPTSPDPIQAVYNTLLNNWGIPAAAAAYGAYKLMKDRPESARGPARRIEPTFNEPVIVPDKSAGALTNTAPGLTPGEQAYGVRATSEEDKRMLNRSLEAKMQKEARRPVAPPAATMPPAAVAPSTTPVAPAATPMTPAPAAPIPTTFAGATVAEPPVAAPTAPAQAAKPPAEKTKSTFKSAADIPSGYVFRPDVGNLDRGLFNILGPEHRLYAKELLNNGMPFGDAGPKDYNQRIAQITEQYWKAVQGQTPETILSREARTAQGVPHGEFGTYGSLGRKAKVAGVAGTLLSAAEAALAAQQGRYGEAAVRGMDVATDFIPGVAAAKQALAPQGVAPGTVPGNILDAAAKLGSPYYETEWARTQRMREAAGAGRGFVNPPLVR